MASNAASRRAPVVRATDAAADDSSAVARTLSCTAGGMDSRMEMAHVLFMDIVGYSRYPIDEQRAMLAQFLARPCGRPAAPPQSSPTFRVGRSRTQIGPTLLLQFAYPDNARGNEVRFWQQAEGFLFLSRLIGQCIAATTECHTLPAHLSETFFHR